MKFGRQNDGRGSDRHFVVLVVWSKASICRLACWSLKTETVSVLRAKNDILSFLRTAIKTSRARFDQMCILRIWSYGLVGDILSLTTFD